MGWFKKPPELQVSVKHVPPDRPLRYPKWTFAQVVDSNNYYLILDKTKMPFISERAFDSWGRNPVLVTARSISGYPTFKKIGFAPGTLLISQADKKEWFITGSDVLAPERRLIGDPGFYTVLGFDINDAYVVSLNEIDFHKKGEDIRDIAI
jgi:hypothetical protein